MAKAGLLGLLAALGACRPPDAKMRSEGPPRLAEELGDAAEPLFDRGLPSRHPRDLDVQSVRPIEVLSWWTRAGDEDSLGKLINHHRLRHPEDIVINGTVSDSALARRTITTRLLRGDPPDLFQANAGDDLMQWVFLNGVDARESHILPLDELVADIANFRAHVPPEILMHATYDGKLYGLPTNVERVNSLFCNKRLFARLHLAPPTTLAAFVQVAQKLRAAGVTPLTMGTREPWTAVLLIFESLLVAREGPSFYKDYFGGHLAADDPRIARTLEEALRIFAYVNPDHAQLSWVQAAEGLMSGRAGMMVTGDWARLLFKVNGWMSEQDYLEVSFPGASTSMVFTSDTFALPIDGRNKPGARRLLATMASAEGQRTVNDVKDQISARLDAPLPANADASTKEKVALMQSGAMLLALSGLTPKRFSEDLALAVAEMLAEQDPEPVLQTLRSRYPLLKQ